MDSHVRIDKAGETYHRSIGVGFDICYNTGDWFNTPLSKFLSGPGVFSLSETPYESTSVCVWYKACVFAGVRNCNTIIYRFYCTPYLV